jgi:hypothetical protein
MNFHNNHHCPHDEAMCQYSHQHVLRYEAVKTSSVKTARKGKGCKSKPKPEAKATTETEKVEEPVFAFPTEITDAQKRIIVVCRKGNDVKVFHHPTCHRRRKHPQNYMILSVGKIIAECPHLRPASGHAGCCHKELCQLLN